MKGEKLQDAIGMIDDELVVDAEYVAPKKMANLWWKYVSCAAAVLVLIIAVVVGTTGRKEDNNGTTVALETESDATTTYKYADDQTTTADRYVEKPTTTFGQEETTISSGEWETTNSAIKPSVDENPVTLKSYALKESIYPTMPQYPDEYSDTFQEDFRNWTDAHNQLDYDYAALRLETGFSYEEFYTKTMREFLNNSDGENLVFSPLNVQMALAMLAETADGNSRKQILNLLGTSDISALRQQTSALWKANYSDDGAVTNILANSLWLRNDLDYNDSTLQTLADYYFASTYSGEMGSDNYNKAMQDWLNEQTGNMLTDQISDINMDKETVAMLASTVYYRAQWDVKFSKKKTEKDTFFGADKDIECDFMNSSRNDMYYWGDNFSAVNMQLKESGGMWIILPDEGINVDELLYNDETIDFIFGNQNWENKKNLMINISVPKFDVNSNIDLKEGLKNLGVTDVFEMEKSNFSALTTDIANVYVSEAKHSARVAIDEEGCVATAFTAIMTAGGAMPPDDEVDFVVNRPFLFVITSDYGLPLFVGIVNNV